MSNPALPNPGPLPDATSDDNLAETARLTLWNAIGKPELAIDVVADGGVVTLSGCLGDEASCRLAEVAVECFREPVEVLDSDGFVES